MTATTRMAASAMTSTSNPATPPASAAAVPKKAKATAQVEGVAPWAWGLFFIAAIFINGFAAYFTLRPRIVERFETVRDSGSAQTVPAAQTGVVPLRYESWPQGIAVTKLTDAVTCFALSLNEWSPAYEAPISCEVELKTPTPAVEWWFSNGEIFQPADGRNSMGSRPKSRTFRIRDMGASGPAVIFLHSGP